MKNMKRAIRLSLTSMVFAAALGAGGTVQAQSGSLPGTPVQAGQVDRTIDIDSGTRWIRVNYGETIKFVVKQASGDQSFSWRFDGYNSDYPTKLSAIAPKALSVKDLPIYVGHSEHIFSSATD